MVKYSHLFKNFPQFVVIHTIKGLSIVNETEAGVFLELPCSVIETSLIALKILSPLQNHPSPSTPNTWKPLIFLLSPYCGFFQNVI